MINATLKRKIIATFGKHYSGKIIHYLTSKECFNSEGKPFEAAGIRNFVNGSRENLEVEMHILTLLEDKKKEAERLKIKKSKILKKR